MTIDGIIGKLGRAIASKDALREALVKAFDGVSLSVSRVFSDFASLVDKLPIYHGLVGGCDYTHLYSSSSSALVANVHSVYFRLKALGIYDYPEAEWEDDGSNYFLGELVLAFHLRENTNGVPATGEIYAKIESPTGEVLSSDSPMVTISNSDYAATELDGTTRLVKWAFKDFKALTPGSVYRVSFYKAGDTPVNVGAKLLPMSASVPEADRYLWPGGFGDVPAYAVLGKVAAFGGVTVRSKFSDVYSRHWSPRPIDYLAGRIV